MRAILLFLFSISQLAWSQSTQQEIDAQVWKSFTKAIMSQDVASFIELHSDDLVRAELSQKKIMNLKEYQQGIQRSWPDWKKSIEKNNLRYTFELRFTERISNGSLAYEIGYFRNKTVNEKGEESTSYGKFQVVLRKEKDQWKILVDSDSNEGGTITEDMFHSAKAIE